MKGKSKNQYYIGYGLYIVSVGVLFPAVIIAGIIELFMEITQGNKAYEMKRYDNPYIAGFMKGSRDWIVGFTILVLIILLILFFL